MFAALLDRAKNEKVLRVLRLVLRLRPALLPVREAERVAPSL